MDSKLTRSATNKLELRDIVLDTSSLVRNQDIDPLLYPFKIEKESSLHVDAEELGFIDEKNEEIKVLRIYINFGLNGFKREKQEESEDIVTNLFTINAVFRVDYNITKDLSDDEIKEFSGFNAVHNAWPFWRQHVYYLMNNAKLPNVVIPFFRQTQKRRKKKSSRRKVTAKK